jgi:porphobilinogen synthase
MYFPTYRPRRLRKNEIIRRMVRETTLSVDDLIYPLFVATGEGFKKEISSMPGNYQMSIDLIIDEAKAVRDLGIPAVLLFGIPAEKDEIGSDAYNESGIVQLAIKAIKKEVPNLMVVTDVCLCEYTSHGHCGIVRDGDVLNDVTLELLAKSALTHAEAGADMVAPSDMMDGRVSAIRSELDRNGFQDIPIMAYSAKQASALYGPFREAAESTPQFGDRRSYQMDAANIMEAIRETALDIEEGADIVMVKPALSCLDLIYAIKREFGYPTAAYNVSGEFSMIKAAVEKGWLDEKRTVLEILTGMKRAGADIIITYHAKDVAKWLND